MHICITAYSKEGANGEEGNEQSQTMPADAGCLLINKVNEKIKCHGKRQSEVHVVVGKSVM